MARGSLGFDVPIPLAPTVVVNDTFVPWAEASTAAIGGVPNAAAPFYHSQPEQPDRVVPLYELGGLPVEIEEVIREMPYLVEDLHTLIT